MSEKSKNAFKNAFLDGILVGVLLYGVIILSRVIMLSLVLISVSMGYSFSKEPVVPLHDNLSQCLDSCKVFEKEQPVQSKQDVEESVCDWATVPKETDTSNIDFNCRKQESQPDDFNVGTVFTRADYNFSISSLINRFKVWDLGNGLFATNALVFANEDQVSSYVVFIPKNMVEKPKYFYDNSKFMETNCFVTWQDLNLSEVDEK